MKVIETPLPGALILEPKVFGDSRGFFFEAFNARAFEELTKVRTQFVQDNHSRSTRGVLRGLHYQIRHAQGKLVRVVAGEVWDVAVDLRRGSPAFGRWFGMRLSAEDKKMFWIPPGFGHGFLVLSDSADFLYKTTDYYDPTSDRTILWNDPTLKIEWPLAELGGTSPVLSTKDIAGKAFKEADTYE